MNKTMKTLCVIAVALGALSAVASEPARANGAPEQCIVITGASDARNQAVSEFRARKRLARSIADYLAGAPAGATVGPTRVNCILRACEASALVCLPY